MATDMPMKTKTADAKRIPNPLYAAAGAGDLAYEQLRKIPGKALELGARAVALRPVVTDAVREPARRVDVDKLRDIAARNVKVLRSQALAAQDRAVAVYADLVARGEKVVGGPYKPLVPAGDMVQATVERTDEPAATEPGATSASGPGTGRSRARATKSTPATAVK
jgi:heparin binding hemagglutinin HbhA